MSQEVSRNWSNFLIAFLALMVAAQAIHWLITPLATSASHERWWAVVAQAVLGIGVAIWFLLRSRRVPVEN